MRSKKIILILLTFSISISMLTGCWNYREVDMISIVAGVAMDKKDDGQYEITTEIIKMSGGRESKMEPELLSAVGETIFDAARNIIEVSGKRLYWSHTRVIVISKDIAREGLIDVLDWYARDAETREDVPILIAKEGKAKDILAGEPSTEDIVSNTIHEIMDNQKSLGKAHEIDILHYGIMKQSEGVSFVVPVIVKKQENGKSVAHITGSAIIKNDKLAGYLNSEETKLVNFINDDIKGGIIVSAIENKKAESTVSLEIFKNKTKVKPKLKKNELSMKIDIKTTVAIDEVSGQPVKLDEENIKKLEAKASESMKSEIEALIKKVQQDYGADIFGFASKVYQDKPKLFKSLKADWEKVFTDLKVEVNVKLRVENSAILAKDIGEKK